MSISVQESQSGVQGWANIALPICLSAMDACWLYTIAWLFTTGVLNNFTSLPLPSPWTIAGIALAAWGSGAFLLDRTTLPTGLLRTLLMALGLVVAAAV